MNSLPLSLSASAERNASMDSQYGIYSGLYEEGNVVHANNTYPWLMQGIAEEPLYLPQVPNKYNGQKRLYDDEIEEIGVACLEDDIDHDDYDYSPIKQPSSKRCRSGQLGSPLPIFSCQTQTDSCPFAYDTLRTLPLPPFSWQAQLDISSAEACKHLRSSALHVFPLQDLTGQTLAATEAPSGHYYLPTYVPNLPSPGPTNLDYWEDSKSLPNVSQSDISDIVSTKDQHDESSSPNTSLYTQHVQNAIGNAMDSSKLFSSSFSIENILSNSFNSVRQEATAPIDETGPTSQHNKESTLYIAVETPIDLSRNKDSKQVVHFTLPVEAPTGSRVAGTTLDTAIGPVAVSYSIQSSNRAKGTQPNPSKTRHLPAQCGICQKYFENNYKLKVHMNSHTGNRPYVCNICNKGFMRSHHLTAHRRLHDPLSRYPCPRCGQEFKQNKDRLNHFVTEVCIRRDKHLRQESNGDWTCITCSGKFQKQKSARAHATTHNRIVGQTKRLVCPWCQKDDFTGKRECTLVSHCIQMHKDQLKSLGVY